MWPLVSPGFQPGSFAVVSKEKKKKKNSSLPIILYKKPPNPKLTLVNPIGPWIPGWSNTQTGQVKSYACSLASGVRSVPMTFELGRCDFQRKIYFFLLGREGMIAR